MPNIIEGIQNAGRDLNRTINRTAGQISDAVGNLGAGINRATRDLNRTINRTAGQISDGVNNASKDPNSLGFGQVNRTARDISRAVDRAKNAPVSAKIDINPFDDGNVGVEFSGGGATVRARAGLNPTGNISGVGASVGASLEGVGGIDVSVGADPTKGKVNYIPGISVKNAQGRTVATTDPIELTQEALQSIGERLEAETNAAEAKAAGEAIRFPGRRNSAPSSGRSLGGGSAPSSDRNLGGGSAPSSGRSLGGGSAPSSGRSLGGGSAPSGGRSLGGGSAPSSGRSLGGGSEPSGGRSLSPNSGSIPATAPEPFVIPEIPSINTPLPKRPQIGGSASSARKSTGNSSGNSNNISRGRTIATPEDIENTRNSNNTGASNNQGKRLVSPEELEDIRNNSPKNKPRISQPQQEKPSSAYRMLSPQEMQLFNCIQNGGGEACNEKYGKAQEKQSSGGENNANGLSLSLGDPYIGLGNTN